MGDESKIVRSRFPDLDIDQRPIHEIMIGSLRSKPERTALVDGLTGRSVTYAELSDAIVRVASGLHRLGVAKGDIVAIFSPNRIEYIVALFAIIANGAAACLVNPTYTTYELEHALKVTKPTWILTVPSLIKRTEEAVNNSSSSVRATIFFSEAAHGDASLSSHLNAMEGNTLVPFEALSSDDGTWYPVDVKIESSKNMALILFSSGTTGLPKGVMVSHYGISSLIANNRYFHANMPPGPPDEQQIYVLFLPLFHTVGLLGVTLPALLMNGKIVSLPRYNTEQLLTCIEKYKVTVVPMVPPTLIVLAKYDKLSKYDLSSVRRYICAAAPLGLETETEFRKVTGSAEVRNGYGMTEATLSGTVNSISVPSKPGSVGILLPNTFAQVVDPETKKTLGPKEQGEVCIKGPQLMMGYLNNPEATKAAIDENGWLHTGDIGYYDEDGYFFIVDRIKELIKCKGFQVAPAELEALILTHPEVADVAVIGVTDKEAGELPKAFVVRRHNSSVSSEEIKQFVAGKVSSYKHLRGGVEFVDKIPKTESGKILRRVLRERKPKSKL